MRLPHSAPHCARFCSCAGYWIRVDSRKQLLEYNVPTAPLYSQIRGEAHGHLVYRHKACGQLGTVAIAGLQAYRHS